MKEGPDIAVLGSLIGEPARANMLTALMSGKSLTATELAAEAGVTVQTASSHLGKLETAGLLRQRRQGRHRYLAGDLGVRMFDSLLARGLVVEVGDDIALSDAGRDFAGALGIDVAVLEKSRRPLCKSCLDWSARRTHLAGALGAAMLTRFYDSGWARRQEGSRAVLFSPRGARAFDAAFPV